MANRTISSMREVEPLRISCLDTGNPFCKDCVFNFSERKAMVESCVSKNLTEMLEEIKNG